LSFLGWNAFEHGLGDDGHLVQVDIALRRWQLVQLAHASLGDEDRVALVVLHVGEVHIARHGADHRGRVVALLGSLDPSAQVAGRRHGRTLPVSNTRHGGATADSVGAAAAALPTAAAKLELATATEGIVCLLTRSSRDVA